jgi:hypothetical protein
MWKISNNATNRASIWAPTIWGPPANCCTPFASGTVELGLHSLFPFKPFQDKSNQFFDGPPTFPEHGECCANYGPPAVIV